MRLILPRYSLLLLEAAIVLLFIFLTRHLSIAHPFPRWFRTLARRRGVAIAICAAFPIVFRLALLPWLGIPEPYYNEEYSFLLQADTFLHGRLTNPPHPFAQHFDAFQELQTPTYTSVRPPAQGAFMAAGRLLTGMPWIGICLGVMLACAAFCWMLQAWFPPEWAFCGALLAALRFGVFTYWINSYWGGVLAALGGALVLGALPRISRRTHLRDKLFLAAGIVLLETTRPFEGLFVIVPALWFLRSKIKRLNFALPLAGCLTAFGIWTAFYNRTTTGNPALAPYQLYIQRYSPAPPFLFQTPRFNLVFPHRDFQRFYTDFELAGFLQIHTLSGFIHETLYRAVSTWVFYFRPAFTLPLCMLPWLVRDRKMRVVLVVLALAAIGLTAETFHLRHYVDPVMPAFLILTVQGMRHLRFAKWGASLVRSVPVACGATFCVLIALVIFRIGIREENGEYWPDIVPLHSDRNRIRAELAAQPGQHLAFVRYRPDHDYYISWIWNDASIDRSKVVWAREVSPADDMKLIHYMSNRKVWLVEADEVPPRVSTYSAP